MMVTKGYIAFYFTLRNCINTHAQHTFYSIFKNIKDIYPSMSIESLVLRIGFCMRKISLNFWLDVF